MKRLWIQEKVQIQITYPYDRIRLWLVYKAYQPRLWSVTTVTLTDSNTPSEAMLARTKQKGNTGCPPCFMLTPRHSRAYITCEWDWSAIIMFSVPEHSWTACARARVIMKLIESTQQRLQCMEAFSHQNMKNLFRQDPRIAQLVKRRVYL